MSFITSPTEWWLEPFADNVFMQSALWASLLAVISTSIVGTWVVLRGLSFLSDALAHGVLPGIAIAFIFGFNTTLGALVAAVVMVGGVDLVKKHSPLPTDTSIGLLFVGFLALAVVLLSSQAGSYVGDLNRFLFGSVTGVSNSDIIRQALTAVLVITVITVFYRGLLVATYNETQAQLLGLRPKLTSFLFLVLLSVTIVASFETVGSLLVFAFLVAPPATAALLARSVPMIMVYGTLLGCIAVVIGLLISFHYATAASATMALVSVLIFAIVLFAKTLANAFPNSAILAKQS